MISTELTELLKDSKIEESHRQTILRSLQALAEKGDVTARLVLKSESADVPPSSPSDLQTPDADPIASRFTKCFVMLIGVTNAPMPASEPMSRLKTTAAYPSLTIQISKMYRLLDNLLPPVRSEQFDHGEGNVAASVALAPAPTMIQIQLQANRPTTSENPKHSQKQRVVLEKLLSLKPDVCEL